jgi:hypothetical protein
MATTIVEVIGVEIYGPILLVLIAIFCGVALRQRNRRK